MDVVEAAWYEAATSVRQTKVKKIYEMLRLNSVKTVHDQGLEIAFRLDSSYTSEEENREAGLDRSRKRRAEEIDLSTSPVKINSRPFESSLYGVSLYVRACSPDWSTR